MVAGLIDPSSMIRNKSADGRDNPAGIGTGHGQNKMSQWDPFLLKILFKTGGADPPAFDPVASRRS